MNNILRRLRYSIALFVVLGFQPSCAKPPPCDMDRYGVNRPENCPAMRAADIALNKNYKQTLAALAQHDDLKLKLKSTQREWLTWADTTCSNYVANVSCANALCFDNAHDECLTAITKKRASELDKVSNQIKKNGIRNLDFTFSKKKVFEEKEKH